MARYPAPATWSAFWWIAESWLSFSSMAGSVVVTRPLRPGAAAGDSDGRPWYHGRLGASWFRTRLTRWQRYATSPGSPHVTATSSANVVGKTACASCSIRHLFVIT